MSRSKILPASIVVLSVTALLTLNASIVESAAEECRAKPGPSGPQGTHWRYRINRPDHRRCWFLNVEAAKVHSRTREAAAESASSSTAAAERDGSAEAAAPIPIRRGAAQAAFLQASAANTSTETAITGPFVPEDEAVTLFSERWPNSSKFREFDVREVAAIPGSYTESYSATSADEQVPSVRPVTAVARSGPALNVAGETAWQAVFQVGTLLVILLAIAAGVFTLALRFRQTHSREPRRIPDEMPAQQEATTELRGRNSGARSRQDRHGLRAITPTDPARDLKKSLAELMGDLRRARTSQYSPRSFAPRKLRESYQKAVSARDLLPPIDGWGQVRAGVTAPVEKVPRRSSPARPHALSSDLPQTALPAGPSLVPA